MGPRWWFSCLLVVWAGDIVALYVGRMWGERKLAPALSPNKTWAGAIGSVVGQPAGGGRAVLAFARTGAMELREALVCR